MNFDMGDLLDGWDYQPGQVVARRFAGRDGVEKIQLRVDLGILQMNAVGRPDGKRPMGHESWFDFWLVRAEEEERGPETLDSEAIGKLQQEAIQYHHRYICLFQLEDYDGVVRDASRNLRLMEFVREHAVTRELSWALNQFYPQTLMMRTRALGARHLAKKEFDNAISAIEGAIVALRDFFRESDREEQAEASGEIQALSHWLEEIRAKRPLSELERLRRALNAAIETENYEEAAKVRDQLRRLEARR
jgi:UvrB/uvrC motif